MDTDVPEEVQSILRKVKKVWKQARGRRGAFYRFLLGWSFVWVSKGVGEEPEAASVMFEKV